jgi:hypothetical protein
MNGLTRQSSLQVLVLMACIMLLILSFQTRVLYAGDKSPKHTIIGYADKNNDKKNDLFQDANGDGVNDVTGEKYDHQFAYRDDNGDGKNDLFQDADGDGVNDLKLEPNNEKKHTQSSIDADGDGFNDITGANYGNLMSGKGFIDEDGDGFNDRTPADIKTNLNQFGKSQDRFIDEDGDGINDGRGFSRDRREKQLKETGHENRPGGGNNDTGGSGKGKGQENR